VARRFRAVVQVIGGVADNHAVPVGALVCRVVGLTFPAAGANPLMNLVEGAFPAVSEAVPVVRPGGQMRGGPRQQLR
jgi:hypothetical protein